MDSRRFTRFLPKVARHELKERRSSSSESWAKSSWEAAAFVRFLVMCDLTHVPISNPKTLIGSLPRAGWNNFFGLLFLPSLR